MPTRAGVVAHPQGRPSRGTCSPEITDGADELELTRVTGTGSEPGWEIGVAHRPRRPPVAGGRENHLVAVQGQRVTSLPIGELYVDECGRRHRAAKRKGAFREVELIVRQGRRRSVKGLAEKCADRRDEKHAGYGENGEPPPSGPDRPGAVEHPGEFESSDVGLYLVVKMLEHRHVPFPDHRRDVEAPRAPAMRAS